LNFVEGQHRKENLTRRSQRSQSFLFLVSVVTSARHGVARPKAKAGARSRFAVTFLEIPLTSPRNPWSN
jgi:hypothetical protein